MTNWKVGMKAVCIEAEPLPYRSLKVGKVYTVAGVITCKHGIMLLDVGGISCTPNWSGYTTCSCACRFRGSWKGARRFRPLLGDEQHELDAIEEEVKETELTPV